MARQAPNLEGRVVAQAAPTAAHSRQAREHLRDPGAPRGRRLGRRRRRQVHLVDGRRCPPARPPAGHGDVSARDTRRASDSSTPRDELSSLAASLFASCKIVVLVHSFYTKPSCCFETLVTV